MTHMPLFSPIFSNQTLIDVFLYFVLNPAEDTYLARIVDATGKALIQVQRTVKKLVDGGLVVKSIRHNKTYYKADTKHVAYDHFKQLALQAKVFSKPFQQDLDRLHNKVDFAFIYGSVASGVNTATSDIDLFFVGSLSYDDVQSLASTLGRELVQEVNTVVFSPGKLEKLIEDKNSFIESVLHHPKIWLFGDKDEFKAIYS